MSDTQHTPGPWKYGPDNRKTMRVFSGSREIVRALSTHGNRRLNCVERAANARLIAAAPELLAALQKVVNRASHAKPDSTGQEMRAIRLALVDELRATIAKATGQ